ncbi:antibiotic biosynthesis monooxygenase family protein [Nocardia blacklockiae]|uniref:antibiotic biosynthesis monooxygenase family protein n=1 Tax=Nocardia blacklockiae TaxID=480036 RepID=UPI00189440CE|nr:antibiotic biosynthesis monooxygenase family protein [Nocardia blacklockiae]MBF6174215.1 antibiotic biosynthesis monooxygenase [Nocardia blacklockiae]
MDSPLTVVAMSSSEPGDADEFGRVLQRFADLARTEPGCLSFDVFRSVEQPERYVTVERYAGADALAAHRSTEHFRDIVLGELMPLFVSGDAHVYGAPIEVPPAE